jgi:hypothetical protein
VPEEELHKNKNKLEMVRAKYTTNVSIERQSAIAFFCNEVQTI